MSGVLEKTFGSLVNSFFGNSQGLSTAKEGGNVPPLHGLKNVTLGLINFVEKLGAARKISRQEEEWCVQKEYEDWLRQIGTPGVSSTIVADLLCRALIASNRGHILPEKIHIHAVNLCQSPSILHKKIGYLYVSQCLGPRSELTVLLINTVLHDLASSNALEVSAGLNILPSIADNKKMIPCSLMALVQCLRHQKPYIRKRAAILIGTIAEDDSEDIHDSLMDVIPHLQHLTTDSNLGVSVAATSSLASLYKISDDDKESLQDLVACSAAHIINESLKGSLPRHYNVGVIPSPFVNLQMMRAIQTVCSDDWEVPDDVINAMKTVLGQPWGGRELTLYMVLLECVMTVAILPRNLELITPALQIVVGFVKSSNLDFKYLGIKGLSALLKHLGDLVTSDQLEIVLDCLYYSDTNLRAKTLGLICNMANSQNYQAVCSTLLEFSSRPENHNFRERVKDQMSLILEKYCNDITWCVISLSPLIFDTESSHKLFLNTVAQIATKAMNGDDEKKNIAQISCCDLVHKIFANDLDKSYLCLCAKLLKLMLLEYPQDDYHDIMTTFTDKIFQLNQFETEDDSIFECLKYIGLKDAKLKQKIIDYLNQFTRCLDIDTRHQVHELNICLLNIDLSTSVLNTQEKYLTHECIPDFTMSFTDNLLIDLLEKGVEPYKPFSVLIAEENSCIDHKSIPTLDLPTSDSPTLASMCSDDTNRSSPRSSSLCTSLTKSLTTSAQVWSAEGRTPRSLDSIKSFTEDKTDKTIFHIKETLPSDKEVQGCVEVAHEAQEMENGEINSQNLVGSKTSQLAQSLLVGFGLSKS